MCMEYGRYAHRSAGLPASSLSFSYVLHHHCTGQHTNKPDRTSRQTQAGIGHSAPAHRGGHTTQSITSAPPNALQILTEDQLPASIRSGTLLSAAVATATGSMRPYWPYSVPQARAHQTQLPARHRAARPVLDGATTCGTASHPPLRKQLCIPRCCVLSTHAVRSRPRADTAQHCRRTPDSQTGRRAHTRRPRWHTGSCHRRHGAGAGAHW